MSIMRGLTTGRLMALMKQLGGSWFEPKSQFSSTAVFSATIAEDTTAKEAAPYEIALPSPARSVLMEVLTAAASATCSGFFAAGVGSEYTSYMGLGNFLLTSAAKHLILFENRSGLLWCSVLRSLGSSFVAEYGCLPTTGMFIGDTKLTGFKLHITNPYIIPANTKFAVYAAN